MSAQATPTGPGEHDDDPLECAACGSSDGPFYSDPGPQTHLTQPPDAYFCRECAADKFDLGDATPTGRTHDREGGTR